MGNAMGGLTELRCDAAVAPGSQSAGGPGLNASVASGRWWSHLQTGFPSDVSLPGDTRLPASQHGLFWALTVTDALSFCPISRANQRLPFTPFPKPVRRLLQGCGSHTFRFREQLQGSVYPRRGAPTSGSSLSSLPSPWHCVGSLRSSVWTVRVDSFPLGAMRSWHGAALRPAVAGGTAPHSSAVFGATRPTADFTEEGRERLVPDIQSTASAPAWPPGRVASPWTT